MVSSHGENSIIGSADKKQKCSFLGNILDDIVGSNHNEKMPSFNNNDNNTSKWHGRLAKKYLETILECSRLINNDMTF